MNFLVNLYDADDGELIWTGPADDLAAQNADDGGEMLDLLNGLTDRAEYGGGAAPTYIIERIP
jgi:hypothetical protein